MPADFKAKAYAEIPEATLKTSTPQEIDEMIAKEYQQGNSILGHVGKFVEPVVRPMELGWKTCVSLIAGAAAKEVVVSTLGVLYVGDDNEEALAEKLSTPSPVTGIAPFTTASALAFMVFVLLYFPCIATLAAIRRETGSWKYAVFSIIYNTGLAWIFAFITFNIVIMFT